MAQAAQIDYELLEAVADFAFIAGSEFEKGNFHIPDSRAMVSEIIAAAKAFIAAHQDTDWCDADYLSAVDEAAYAFTRQHPRTKGN